MATIDESIFMHHTVALDDVRLHYVIAGSGDPVVLLHGWPQTWFEWRRIIPALADKYTVIAPDLRGLGDSSKPLGGYDKRTVAADIYKLVRKLGFERIYLVGHDWGGPTAYALRSPIRRTCASSSFSTSQFPTRLGKSSPCSIVEAPGT